MTNNKAYLLKEEASIRDEWKSADADGRYRKSGIIYMNHQPGKNYYMANGAGDTDMKIDILMSELAKMIISNKKKIILLLNKNGITTADSISKNALIEKVGKALYSNIKFSEDIAAEIVQGGAKLSATGEAAPKKSFGELIGGVSEAAKNVKDLIGTVFGGKNKNQQQAQQSTAVLKDHSEAINKINNAGIGAAGYILIALGASIAIGGAVYFMNR